MHGAAKYGHCGSYSPRNIFRPIFDHTHTLTRQRGANTEDKAIEHRI